MRKCKYHRRVTSSDVLICCKDELSLTTPFYKITPNPEPAFTQEVVIDEVVNATGNLEWRMNYQPFRGNYNYPLLLLAQEKNTSFSMNPEWNVYNFGSNETVRMVINNNSTISHVCIAFFFDGEGLSRL